MKKEMLSNFIKGTIFAFLTGLGTMGNISVFVSYVLLFAGNEKKSIHLILLHLAITNTITLLSKGMPSIIAPFGVRNFLDDTGCKIVAYLERVAPSLTMCTSALLTVVQAVTISPAHSRWRKLKFRSPWHILHLCLFFWVLNSSIGMNLLFSITSTTMNTSKDSRNHKACHFRPENQKIKWTFFTVMIIRAVMFLGIMGTASGYMVFLLHRHHQRVLRLQISKSLYKLPPEIKAARSILLLMLCFLFFYWTDCVFSIFINFFLENNFILLNIRNFMTLGYAIVCPFVLIHRDAHLAECWRAL
ncbi:LOW QUALITY PROTEIN: vomeronasal type-1 receptor 4-like [Fukomys damarensis]|uniref:LOW QUALITY PROTEIN: vomeronasal type-1 receptor 4-like n=1 Tax=Fukomys damarensis TaxID=885580 RepID=UPI0008FEAF23|nr:LOW QUALITY PROTEIN: vomeronasal type-1 receptor 4-like [Fukomys damarensis]